MTTNKESTCCERCRQELLQDVETFEFSPITPPICSNHTCPCHRESENDWSVARLNLKQMAEKYPATLLDVVDAAYLAGLEAVNPDLKSLFIPKQDVGKVISELAPHYRATKKRETPFQETLFQHAANVLYDLRTKLLDK